MRFLDKAAAVGYIYGMETKYMGQVNAEIRLLNSGDVELAQRGCIKPEEVRTATVTAVADTGAMYPVITERR